jgi:hypothetical protein
MSGELEKRASDAEREQAVVRLREASAEGRLTLEELADRTALAYEARSQAELVRVVTAATWSSTCAKHSWRPLVRVRAVGLIGEVKVVRS